MATLSTGRSFGKRPDGMARRTPSDRMAELRGVFARVDTMMAPFSCPASTGCCRFGQTGREPYLTRLEEEALRSAQAARPSKKLPLVGASSDCTFLQGDGRCSVYETRPFGCRTFFCEEREGPKTFPRREVNRLAQELLELSIRHFPEQREVRAMRRLFARRG